MEKGCVRGGGLCLWGKVASRSIAALSWRHPGRKWPGDRGWRAGHWRYAESACLMGARGHLFCSVFQWCWAGDSVLQKHGWEERFLYVSSLNGLSNTNLPTFNVQKTVHLANTGEHAFFICFRWAYWHLLKASSAWDHTQLLVRGSRGRWMALSPQEARFNCLTNF